MQHQRALRRETTDFDQDEIEMLFIITILTVIVTEDC